MKSTIIYLQPGILLFSFSIANAQCPEDHAALTPAPLEES